MMGGGLKEVGGEQVLERGIFEMGWVAGVSEGIAIVPDVFRCFLDTRWIKMVDVLEQDS
jgi:hypothetical protein